MPLPTISEMVKQRLPFLPALTTVVDPSGPTTLQQILDTLLIEQEVFLQPWSKISDADMEDLTKYSSLQKLLIVRLICYQLFERQILQEIAGINGAAGSASDSTTVKKAKADVVEVEFMEPSTANDGLTLAMKSTDLINAILEEICNFASSLRYQLPMCRKYATKDPLAPAFMVVGGYGGDCFGCGDGFNPEFP